MLLPTILAACGGAEAPPPGTTEGAPCPDGAPAVVAPPELPIERWVPGTVVSTCADGPHAEDWPTGAPAARGTRLRGRRSGTWTRWTPDGRFDGLVDYDEGGAPTARREPSSDGRLAEVAFRDGKVVGWEATPARPMPEWTGGVLAPGTRWAEARPTIGGAP
jgi:hypothetical protein